MEFHHIPVLLNETLQALECQQGDIIVDATLGAGGHAAEILRRITPGGLLIGIDRDPHALKAAGDRLGSYGESLALIHDNYVNIKDIINGMGISSVDGVLMDLGVSSYQLDTKERGFSYKEDAPLDMRMDPGQPLSAYHVVNRYSHGDLTRIIREYGEERWAGRIADFIIRYRPVESTGRLVEIIKMAIPAAARRKGPHPAKRTFQAIRIEVNQELSLLEQAVRNGIDVLKPEGRLCIITFHSLEDRIVKRVFQKLENPCICSPKAPLCSCGKTPQIRVLTKKPLKAGKDELETNPRSRSAKLRACQKL